MQQLDTKTSSADVVGIDMAAYFVNDPAAAIGFYRDVLGLTPTSVDARDAGRNSHSRTNRHSVSEKNRDTRAPGAAVMFAVGDIKKAVARLRARGLSVADPFEAAVCFMAAASNPLVIHQRKR